MRYLQDHTTRYLSVIRINSIRFSTAIKKRILILMGDFKEIGGFTEKKELLEIQVAAYFLFLFFSQSPLLE